MDLSRRVNDQLYIKQGIDHLEFESPIKGRNVVWLARVVSTPASDIFITFWLPDLYTWRKFGTAIELEKYFGSGNK